MSKKKENADGTTDEVVASKKVKSTKQKLVDPADTVRVACFGRWTNPKTGETFLLENNCGGSVWQGRKELDKPYVALKVDATHTFQLTAQEHANDVQKQ